ncbi:SURF1 family protein [Comamonas sp. J-3]|uniref:SURF1 family protein n=1 Tax=Comamonas trifloxystrobinivorans TaxID=3350256 RepID=UPI003726878C
MLAFVGIALFLGFCALGTWQVYRLQWKLDLIDRVERRVHSAPQALPAPASWQQLDAKALEYQPSTVQGQWLAGKTVLTQATTALGAGFWVLTPLQQADGSQVLVNRGFVPDSLRATWSDPQQLAAATPTGEVTVTGLLRATEPKGGFLRNNEPANNRWFSRDVQAIAQSQGLAAAAPFFVDAGMPDASTQVVGEAKRSSAADLQNQVWPRTGLTQIRFTNNHLVYALTWYGLALMVVGAAWLVMRHQRRKG